MILDYLQALLYSHWMVIGLVLLIAEVFVGGAFLMWMGFSALIVGLLMLLTGDSITWQWQFIIFSAFSLLSVFAWKKYVKPVSMEGTQLNQRGSQYIGRVYALVDPIKHGRGRINIDDTRWTVCSDTDADVGASVKIVAQRDNEYDVEVLDD